jgi:hypothetical protein
MALVISATVPLYGQGRLFAKFILAGASSAWTTSCWLILEMFAATKAMYDFFLTQINQRVSEIGWIDIPLMN